jgi:hypothetical protein
MLCLLQRMKLEIYIILSSQNILEIMKFHPNHICIITCPVTFGLRQRFSVECQGVLRVPWWCYDFCIVSCSIKW